MFDGIELPETYEVHFSNQPVIGDAKTFLGDATGVEIPDEYLTTGDPIYVWIYLHTGEDDGETVYAITVPVIARPRPVEEAPTPAQRGLIDQAITVLTVGVERVEAAQQAIEDMGATAQTLQPGSQATVTKTVDPETGAVTLHFGVPQGIQGPPGEPGSGVAVHICTSDEYDATTRVPTIQNPEENIFYLVPAEDGETHNMFVEWIYTGNEWEIFGNTSIDLSDYVKNTDYATSFNLAWGLAKIGNTSGLYADNSGWHINRATDSAIKAGTDAYKPLTPSLQHHSTFYGLAKAAGDNTQAASSNPVGTYTNDAKANIRNMIGAGTYSVPGGGIPSTDMDQNVRNSLGKADTALQEAPVTSVNNKTGAVTLSPFDIGAGTYSKPSGGIPSTDMTEAVQTSLSKANTALQSAPVTSVNAKTGAVVLTPSDIGAGTYSKPSGGIPSTDMSSAVQTSLGKADTALQSAPVTDVQVNGTSILSNGVANVPMAGSDFGAVKIDYTQGIGISSGGLLQISGAADTDIKSGGSTRRPIQPSSQHKSTFYGLAKAAGDSTQSASSNAVGTYTDSAKTSIQSMLDVPSQDTIADKETATATAPHTIGDLFLMGGKLYKATAAIAIGDAIVTSGTGANAEQTNIVEEIPTVPVTDVQVNGTSVLSSCVANIPLADDTNPGTVKINDSYGFEIDSTGLLKTKAASASNIKAGTNSYRPIASNHVHEAAFYGLATAAGDSTQSSSSNAVGTYTEDAKRAIQEMLGLTPLIATITVTNNTVSLDKTNTEILDAIQHGREVYIVANRQYRYSSDAVTTRFYYTLKSITYDSNDTSVVNGATFELWSSKTISNVLYAIQSTINVVYSGSITWADSFVKSAT